MVFPTCCIGNKEMSDSQMTIINHNIRGIVAAQSGFLLPIRVLSSRAGYYIGTFSETHGAISRESVEYYPTQRLAEEAFRKGTWTQRKHP